MQHRINPDIDIVNYVLEQVLKAKPNDSFCKSIQTQYLERGGLSKKQLEGLHGKALRISGINTGKLATLEAIIKKMHVTQRSTVTIKNVVEEKDVEVEKMLSEILKLYPTHKRVLLFNTKFIKENKLITVEKTELEKFYKLLIKK
ncbi:MAG: hypothetical protein ABL929_02925 [Ferruginibacter sp.]|nr:hypothetical protein [Ferruginibacter sp.]